MNENKDLFYLDKMFPDPEKVFSAQYESLDTLFKDAIFVFDTSALLVPFDTSEKNVNEIKSILLILKQAKRLFIPARVAREFANNRATKLGNLFLSLRQLKNNINTGAFKIGHYPLLEGIDEYSKLENTFAQITESLKMARKHIENIEDKILSWTWNDGVSLAYKEIFTSDTIEQPSMSDIDLAADLKFRYDHKIAPGYQDSSKIDDGIGDLIVWHTILAIGKKYSANIILVSNDEKNDWFHKQDRIAMYPKFELYDEFRRASDGKSFSIINFLKFLELSNAKPETLQEVKESLNESKSESEEDYQTERKNLVEGLQIAHMKWGIGTITKIQETTRSGPIIDVQFNEGRKRLIVKYAKLQILSTKKNRDLLEANFEIAEYDNENDEKDESS